MCCVTTRSTHLSTWISSDLRQRFAAEAARQGLSESALLKILVERALAGTTTEIAAVDTPAPIARGARVTVRLLPEDRALLAERANARGIPAASYVSALVRSHLRKVVPLPDRELHALRNVVTQLAAVGRNLNAIAKAATVGSQAPGPSLEHVRIMLKICEGLRDHVRQLISANISSWEDGDGQTHHRASKG